MLRVLGTWGTLNLSCRPSEFIGIDDDYVAYCFDEAAAFIVSKIRDGEDPIVRQDNSGSHKSSFSSVYSKYEV